MGVDTSDIFEACELRRRLSEEQERLMKLPLRELKQILESKGVSTSGMIDRESLLEAFKDLPGNPPAESRQNAGIPIQSVRMKSRRFPQLLGSGIFTGHNRYFTVEIRFRDPRNPASKKESSMEFIIDTAASTTLISEKAARVLSASETGVYATGTTATGAIAGGQRQVLLGEGFCDTSDSGSLSLGAISPVSMPVLPFDYDTTGIAGILGLDVLSKFDLVFDFSESWLQFYPPGSLRLYNNVDIGVQGLTAVTVSKIPSVGLWHIPVTIAQHGGNKPQQLTAFPVIIDTGAAGSVFSTNAARSGGIELGPSTGVISGADRGQMPMFERDIFLNFPEVCNRFIPVQKAGFADLPIFTSIFPGSGPVGVLGLDVLAGGPRKKIAFSAASRTIWLDV